MKNRRCAAEYSQKELDWIEANQAGITRDELVRAFNAKFKRDLVSIHMEYICKRKGWRNGVNMKFKAGMEPTNHKPIGHERVTKDGYTRIKVAQPNKYELKHRHVWRQHNGEIPPRHVIRFLDGNRSNCVIENLICVPTEVNGKVNYRDKRFTDDAVLNETVLLTETIIHHTNTLT